MQLSSSPANSIDWTHGNAVVYSPADGDLLLSLRHQHWVIKIDFKDGFGTGNILWRLGNEGDFTLLNGTVSNWQYAQHFPFIIDNQIGFYRLAVFDNGNNRILDDTGTICGVSSGINCYSRAVIYEIDEAMGTVRQLWEGRTDEFASFAGSVQLLGNDNILWDAATDNLAQVATIREVTQEVVPRTVWEAKITGQFMYRSLRLPSLYPGVQW